MPFVTLSDVRRAFRAQFLGAQTTQAMRPSHPIVSGENRNRKDATVGAKRLGLHRSLCGFAADRDRRPPLRALSAFSFPFERPFRGAIAWKSQGRRDQRERRSPLGFHVKSSLRKNFPEHYCFAPRKRILGIKNGREGEESFVARRLGMLGVHEASPTQVRIRGYFSKGATSGQEKSIRV